MSKLHFVSRFASPELNSLDLPVEVRKPDLSIVARSLTSQTVELAPGTYCITAKLPAGQQLSGTVQVEEGKEATATLAPEPEVASPHEWQEMQHYILGPLDPSPQVRKPVPPQAGSVSIRRIFGRGQAEGSSELEPLLPASASAKLHGYRGNLLLGAYEVKDEQGWLTVIPPVGTAQFHLYAVSPGDTTLVQLLQPEVPALNMVLPVSPEQGCQLVLMRQPNGFYSLDANLEHGVANTLLRYLQRGLLEQANTITGSDALTAEQLLYGKMRDPVAAAVGAYALLRLGDLERLHDWTENLRNYFGWLPDGIAIRGEHLARLGEHDQALTVLLELPSRGLPIFSDGLSYALDRLRLYARAGEKSFDRARLSQAQTLLEQLQRFAAFVDFRRPIVTFAGVDPGNPSNGTPGEDIASYGGLDIGQ